MYGIAHNKERLEKENYLPPKKILTENSRTNLNAEYKKRKMNDLEKSFNYHILFQKGKRLEWAGGLRKVVRKISLFRNPSKK